jgi:hypothetical protein
MEDHKVVSAPEGMVVIAVTPVNFDEIIERSQAFSKHHYTEERLKEIRAQARERNSVAFVCFMDDAIWHKEEGVGLAVHDTLR